ncbi:MAG: ribbon-helix-helix protein, CopG family [Myxococcota bacterium]
MHLDVGRMRHHDASMRTTLTIDDDLHALLEQRARMERRSVREVVNDALREALVGRRSSRPYRVEVHHARFMPGIDPERLNQLADELEDDEFLARMGR